MPDIVAELAERGRALDPQDRARLVDLLLDSLTECPDPTVNEAWRLEIRRRVAAYQRGETQLYDEIEVMDEAKTIAP